jgi:hypothetical protein
MGRIRLWCLLMMLIYGAKEEPEDVLVTSKEMRRNCLLEQVIEG